MKKSLLFSALAVTASTAMALPLQHISANQANLVRYQRSSQPTFMQQVPARQLNATSLQATKAPSDNLSFRPMGINKAAQAEYSLFYGFGEGTYHSSLVWGEGNSGKGFYSYNYAYALSYPYTSTFVPNATRGVSWRMDTESGEVSLSENVTEDGSLVLSNLGTGAFYMPTLFDKRSSYTYGSASENQVIISGIWEDASPLQLFDALESSAFYGGFSDGGYGFGSVTPYGTSGAAMLDYGQVGGEIIVDNFQMWITTDTQVFASDDDYILVTIFDEVGDETFEYKAIITEADIEGTTTQCATGYFMDVDEDGFESMISPVLRGYVTVVIENTPGCDYGIIFAYEDMKDAKDNNPLYPIRSYWYCDGSADDMEEAFYSWSYYDAVAWLNGTMVGLCEYTTGSKTINGFIPEDAEYSVTDDGTEYTLAYGFELEGQWYNDFLVETTFDPEQIEIYVDDPDALLGYDYDFDSYDPENMDFLAAYYFAVAKLPEGVEGRQLHITLVSQEAAELEIVINQGNVSGINNVVVDNTTKTRVYNLNGQASEAKNGLYVKDGKVIFVK